MSVGIPTSDPATLQLLQGIQTDFDTSTANAAHVIAEQIVYAGKQRNIPCPVKTTDLAFAITKVDSDHTTGVAGAPTIVLTIQDPRWVLLDSGFFACDPKTGKLLDLDINYPQGSRFWWRLHQFSPQQDKSIQLTFVPRIVAELMGLFGPIQVNRASRTRAEFLKMLCSKVKDRAGPIEFYSRELDVKQPVSNTGASASTASTSKITTTAFGTSTKAPPAPKLVGVGANRSSLTCKGQPLTSAQAQVVNIILQVADQLAVPKNAAIAACYAGMGESNLDDTVPAGVFQTTGNASFANGGKDTAAQVTAFFKGEAPFGSPGAIAAANRGDPPWMIANETEVNAVWLGSHGDSYGHEWPGGQSQGITEATAMVDGGGLANGGSGGTTSESGTISVAQPYYFSINAGEDYWTGMCRLAQEVAWTLVVDGNRIYYDPDTEMIKQKVAAVIDRDDPTTFKWSYDWENRFIATNFQIQVAMDLFEFVAGEVVQVKNFGPASLGSTCKMPGRWLVKEIQHNGGDVYSTLSLEQPTPSKPEPSPQMTTQTVGGSGGATSISGPQQAGTAEAAFQAATQLAAMKLSYTQSVRTMQQNGYAQGSAALDCSASTSWILLKAGFQLPGGITWGGWAPVSGDYVPGQAGLLAGPGQYMTIYANSEHVFIRIHPQGLADMQGNTVSPLVGMKGFDFFPWNTPGCGGWGGPNPGVGAPSFGQVHYPGT